MQLRALTLAACLGLTASLYAQDLTKKVDYETKAVSFAQAFSALSKQAGIGLFPEPDLANEIIILRLKDTTLQAAMDKIADTVGAKWVKKPDGYELDRTPEILDKLRQDAQTVKAKLYQDSLAKQTKQMNLAQELTQDQIDKMVAQIVQLGKNKPGPGQDFREIMQVRNSLPDQRAVLRVLSMIDPNEIVNMEDGQRLVYSNRPTPMQREMEGDFSTIATQLKDEHNLFLAAYNKAKDPDPNHYNYYFSIPDGTIDSVPDRFVLSVTRPFLGDSLQLSLIAFDGQNHPICSTDANLQMDDNMEAMMADRAKVARQNLNEPDIDVSPITKQMLDFIRQANAGNQGGGNGIQAVTGDLRQALLNPERADPLAFALSEAFLGIADLRNENLVLYPDDSMFLVSMLAGMEGTFKPSLILQAVNGFGQILPTTVAEQEGWMTVAPVDRVGTLKTRMSRSALGTYLRAGEENGFVTISSSATLAANVDGFQLPILAMFVPMMLSPDYMDAFGQDISMLKVYATFNDSQIQRLEDKTPLRITDLSRDQANLLTRMVYQSSQPGGPVALAPDQRPSKTPAEFAAEAELTEAVPDGLGADAYLTMDTHSDKTYFAKITSGNSTFTQSMDINNMAWYSYQMKHPNQSQGDWHPKIISIEPGESRTLTFYIHLPNGKTTTSTLKEERKTGGGPWKMDELPDDLKAQLAKAEQGFNRGQEAGDADAPAAVPPRAAPPP